jgi:natural product precursor
MKAKVLKQKLVLKKQTISNLENTELANILGGDVAPFTTTPSCPQSCRKPGAPTCPDV